MSSNTLQSNCSAAKCVLMAEPSDLLRECYREPLTQAGFNIIPAVSGLECMARLRERVPDVLVLEPQLPWGGGDGVLACMGEVPHLANIPVLVLTSCRDSHVLEGVARFSISDYHVKPLAPHRLARRLHALLNPNQPRDLTGGDNLRLECLIARQTGGRIEHLRVDAVDNRAIVRGRTSSRHAEELARAAVQDALQTAEFRPGRIEWAIEVR